MPDELRPTEQIDPGASAITSMVRPRNRMEEPRVMKIVRIDDCGVYRWGRLEGDVVETTREPTTLADFAYAHLDHQVPYSQSKLLPPLTSCAKVLCVGLNYRDHVLEMGREVPTRPVIFTRFPDSLVGPGESLALPYETDCFDFEGEFAVVMGRTAHRVTPEDALQYVLGYTVLNDGSLRDFQRHTSQFTPGKNFLRSGSIGPWVVTPEEFGAVDTQRLTTWVNNEIRQDSALDQLIFDVPALIAYISQWTVLRPGDVIATGTPGGVADGSAPPRWLKHGDVVRVHIERIGSLTNDVVADPPSQP